MITNYYPNTPEVQACVYNTAQLMVANGQYVAYVNEKLNNGWTKEQAEKQLLTDIEMDCQQRLTEESRLFNMNKYYWAGATGLVGVAVGGLIGYFIGRK